MNQSKKYLQRIKPNLKKPWLPIFILIIVIIAGMVGYWLLWHEQYPTDIVDVLYMTIITLTTVGYTEVHPLADGGRLFTMFIAVFGIAALFYVFTTVMENLVILQLHQFRRKKKMMKQIDKLQNHIIVAGFGRVGQLVTRELVQTGEHFVVIDNDFIEDDIFNLKGKILTIQGDATVDETLLLAGVERARAMIIATANPATTVFVTLSAKVLNPDIFIAARSDDYNDIEKLKRSGADRVVNPYTIGGQRLVSLTLNPNVVDFFVTNFMKQTDIKIETIILPDNSPWCGKTLEEIDVRKKCGATILAVVRDNETVLNPGRDFVLQPGDQVLAFATAENIKQMEKLAFS
jgi:voltage-gated potassium channel